MKIAGPNPRAVLGCRLCSAECVKNRKGLERTGKDWKELERMEKRLERTGRDNSIGN